MRRYVIIGTGAAGITAAQTIRSKDQAADILTICEEPYGFYSRPGLAFYLTGEIPEPQLYPFSQKDFRRLNLRLLHAHATRIDGFGHRIELHDGTTVPYDRALIATGAKAATNQVPGNDLVGVIKLDNMDDARHIVKMTRNARSAVVVGGGITALELVEGLRARGVKTHYLLRRDRYWSNVLDETESRIVENRLKEEGVLIHYHSELTEILGRRGRVSAVRTQDDRYIECELVAIAIGIRPRKELAEASGVETDRGILVNEFLQTSQPDIFAAGDVAQVYDPFLGKSILDSLWGPAREQGHAAGLNMFGQRTIYVKTVAFNVTRLAGLTTTIIGTVGKGSDDDVVGIMRGDSETWRQLPDAIAAQDNFNVNRLRILVGKQTLIGAIVMGDQTLSRPLHQLIEKRVDITNIRRHLLKPNPPLADLIVDFWTQWRESYASQHA
jgi:NAD(P)H-nitrite reductase large subunit